MSGQNKCALCASEIDPHSSATWKQVTGWVGGPRKDSMRLREDTGRYAHDACVAKIQRGQSVDQPDLWEKDTTAHVAQSDVSELEELLDE